MHDGLPLSLTNVYAHQRKDEDTDEKGAPAGSGSGTAAPGLPRRAGDAALGTHGTARSDRFRTRRLAPGGRLPLGEGRWSTGGGLCAALVRACRQEADVVPLTDPALWGRAVDDERHLVVSRR